MAHYDNLSLKMRRLPGPEYMLYTMIREFFKLRDMRDVFILAMRMLYHCWSDPRLRHVLITEAVLIREWENMTTPSKTAQKAHYEAFEDRTINHPSQGNKSILTLS